MLVNNLESKTNIEQHSLLKSIILHLLPGALLTTFYLIIAPFFTSMGLPSLSAFIVSVVCTSMPFELVYLLLQGKKKNGVISLKGLFPYQESVSKKQYLIFVPILVIWGAIWLGFIPMFFDKQIIKNLFQWLPEWFNITGFIDNINHYSRNVLVVTLILGAILTGILAPYVEELYFRGYLLPRISRFNGWSVLINSILFSLYHFHQPWGFFSRVFFLLPMVFIVWRKKNIKIAILVHCILGALSMISTIPLVFM